MPAVGIVSGQTFTVTLPTGLANLGTYSNPRVYYKKPNGDIGFVTGVVNGTDMTGTIPVSVNTLASYGEWDFLAYCEGGSGEVYRSRVDTLFVTRSF